ncbi:MAG TPA: glycoside hydrolase family 75 protein [Chthoniobacteraceae bacterium]|nr:glycoside hydrolase family 75 protein [Chthoniobacteraceae bacterium]
MASSTFNPRAAAAAAALALGLALGGCKPTPRDAATPTPSPTPALTPDPGLVEMVPTPSLSPTPAPTPIYIPRKSMEVGRLYSGIELETSFESEPGGIASLERSAKGSYKVELKVKVRVPKASQSLEELQTLNASLPTLLPGLATMLEQAEVSGDYEELYRRKLRYVEYNAVKLEQLLSRHNFYDCETVLHLRHPETGRAVVLWQSEMDIDTDGSDGDRIPNPEGKDRFFQPMTSYRWPKLTEVPNPFLARAETRLREVEGERIQAKGAGAAALQEISNRIGAARYEVNQLRKYSFLISATDPFIVLPGFVFKGDDKVYTPALGDYCAVIYNDVLYPAIVGDVGPSFKAGEASLRMAKELNPRSSAISRPVSDLKVTYVIFPNSADPTPGPPDLDRWHERVGALLGEIGGFGGKLHRWETIAQAAPTPTPEPTPTPLPTPEIVASPSPSETLAPAGTPSPAGSPSPVGTPSPAGSPSPVGTPSPAAPLPGATPEAVIEAKAQ